jgi:hypothetical protein
MNQNFSLFYGLESLLGVIGLYPVIIKLRNLDTPNPLESKIKNIFLNLAALLVIRFPYQAFGNHLSKRLTYALATILILNIFLYFETLLRRHMPLFLKISVSIFVFSFLIDTLFLNFIHEEGHLIALGVVALLIMSSIIITAILRKKSDYTRSENSLIDISLISLVLLVIFLLSDTPTFHQILKLPHLGVMGILLFTYASFHDQTIMSNNKIFLIKLIKTMLFSGLAVYMLSSLLPGLANNIAIHSFVLMMNIILVIRIHFQAKELEASNNMFNFIENLVESDKTSLDTYMKDMYKFFSGLEVKSFNELELKSYNMEGINSYFTTNKTHLISVLDLRNMLSKEKNKNTENNNQLEIIEQMVDLLEKFEMSHLFRLNEKHARYVAFNFYLIGQSNIIYSQTALISEVAKIFDKKN